MKKTKQQRKETIKKFEKEFPLFLAKQLYEHYEKIKKEKKFNLVKERILTDAINRLTWNVENQKNSKDATDLYMKALNELDTLAARLETAQDMELIALELKYSK